MTNNPIDMIAKYCKAIWFFLRIVYRRRETLLPKGYNCPGRISCGDAWSVAKGLCLNDKPVATWRDVDE